LLQHQARGYCEQLRAEETYLVSAQTIQEIPLNGRHFSDLGLLVPGSVSPSQAGFSSRPIRGVGALAFNTAGNREEAVAFEVNGVQHVFHRRPTPTTFALPWRRPAP
jgi:hypothetical protein